MYFTSHVHCMDFCDKVEFKCGSSPTTTNLDFSFFSQYQIQSEEIFAVYQIYTSVPDLSLTCCPLYPRM